MANPFESDTLPAIDETSGQIRAQHGIKFSVGGDSPQKEEKQSFLPQQQQQLRATEERISLDSIAKVLLHENFILTALELHAELLESGRELKRLGDFFSNPVNFESTQMTLGSDASLLRTSSIQTFDSFDGQSHGSDELGNDRVAVLEFELRKARETISSLRDQLTTASEQSGVVISAASTETVTDSGLVSLTQQSGEQRPAQQMPVLAHEQKALNFLTHEYLLQQEYKLTSVTFSDEVPDQDFEDWDEVGLNIPRPSDLLTLYREFCHSTPGYIKTTDVGLMTNLDAENNPFFNTDEQVDLLNRLNSENSELLDKNGFLSEKIERLTVEIEQMRRQMTELVKPNQTNDSKENPEFRFSPTRPTVSSLRPLTSDHKIERTRSVPQAFVDAVHTEIAKDRPSDYQQWLEQIDSIPKNVEGLVGLLTEYLPKLIPHVLLNKRDDLIPLILSSVLLHPSSKETEQLLADMFNLVKKPESKQRHMILGGCAVFAKYAGPTRIEAELLPLCWEQIGHKHLERRLLVAETCGALASLIPPSLISSLVLSMLQQMLLEDKSERVREAVVASLASICLYIEDKDKFSQMTDLVQRALLDTNESVVSLSQAVLLPVFSVWADQIGKLQLGVVSLFVRKLAQILHTSGATQSANETIMCTYVGCLHNLTTILYWSVLRSGPFATENDDDNLPSISDNRYSSLNGPLSSPFYYCDDFNKLTKLTAAYDKHTVDEWYTTWDAFDYVVKDMLPQIVTLLDKLEVNLAKTVPLFVRYFQHFSLMFGKGFSKSKLRPLFLTSLKVGGTKTNDCGVCRATLPVYCAGVLSAFRTEEDWQALRKFLRSIILSLAESNASTQAVTVTFCELCKYWQDHSMLLSLVYESLLHKNANVRRMCAEILSKLSFFVTLELLESKVIAGLITLAADNEPSVRVETIPGLISVLSGAQENENLKDKVNLQIGSLFDDPDIHVTSQLVRCLAQAAPNLEAEFRDDYVLPRLVTLAERTNELSDAESRKQQSEALFEVYSALSCCFLSPAAISQSFLPGMRHLLKGLDPEHIKIASSILRDAENKLGAAEASMGRSNESTKLSNLVGETSVDEVRNRMFSTIRDIKGKMDQHRADVPNIFRKK